MSKAIGMHSKTPDFGGLEIEQARIPEFSWVLALPEANICRRIGSTLIGRPMKLLEILERHFASPAVPTTRDTTLLYPSSASVVVDDPVWGTKIHGACLRREFYRITGVEQSDVGDTTFARVTGYGDALADWEIQKLREAGVPVVAVEHRFFIPGWRVSGRLDAVVIDTEYTNEFIGIEYKSTSAMGMRYIKHLPKVEHMLQVLVYASVFKDTIHKWKIIYVCREPMGNNPVEHDVQMMENGCISVNGQAQVGITIQGIFKRYEALLQAVDSKKLPDRDYALRYPPEQISFMAERSMLTKRELELHRKGKAVEKGDWNCRYCSYKSLCYKQEG